MEDLEVSGDWWLPNDPDHKVKGTLQFAERGDSTLTLLGSLKGMMEEAERTEAGGLTTYVMTEAALTNSGTYPRILGSDGNVAYTLEDCIRTRSRNTFFKGDGLETVYVNRAFKGAWFQLGEPLAGTGVSFGLDYLEDWIMESGFKKQINFAPNGELGAKLPRGVPRFVLEAREKPPRRIRTRERNIVRLDHSVGLSGKRITEHCLTQGFSWTINSPTKVELHELLHQASDLQDLISIGTNRSAAFSFVKLWHPDIYREESEGKRKPAPIDLYAHWIVESAERSRDLTEHEMVFTFGHLGQMKGVRQWINAVLPYRRALGRVMATRYSKQMYVTDRLLNCSAALEAFDRGRTGTGNSTFKTRMNRCAKYAGTPFLDLIGDISLWAEAARVERDDAAHNLGVASTSTRAYHLWQSLYWLFVLCMIRESGLPERVETQLQQHQEVRRLKAELAALLNG